MEVELKQIDPLKYAMATHSSTLAWKILWTEEPGRLQSMGLLRVGYDSVTSHSLFTFMHWRRKWQPTPVFLPGESQGWGPWWAAVYGVAQSWTRLKRLSSSSSSKHRIIDTLSCPTSLLHQLWFCVITGVAGERIEGLRYYLRNSLWRNTTGETKIRTL